MEAQVTFEARDEDLYGAGVVCRLLSVSRRDQPQEGQADEGQIPPHHACWQDTGSWRKEGINSDGNSESWGQRVTVCRPRLGSWPPPGDMRTG